LCVCFGCTYLRWLHKDRKKATHYRVQRKQKHKNRRVTEENNIKGNNSAIGHVHTFILPTSLFLLLSPFKLNIFNINEILLWAILKQNKNKIKGNHFVTLED